MSPTQQLPPKKDVALALLERSSVSVHLDPRQSAVVVPPGFKKQPQLVLQVGLNMPVPIPDLRFDDDAMRCTLSFNRRPFYCEVPWSSVFAIVSDDGQGMVWPEDVPIEVVRQAQGRTADGDARPKEPPKAGPPRESKDTKVEAPPAKRARNNKRSPLAAVPGEQDVPSRPAKPAQAVRPAAASPPRPVAASAPPSRPAAAGQGRRKRELPPYLRVVK